MHRLHGDPDLCTPTLVVAFDGWVSAGAVGTTAAEHIAGGGQVIADFPPDRLFDFRVSRPTVSIDGAGRIERITWPTVELRHRRIEGRDLLVLKGPEPNWNWQEFAASVADMAARLDVSSMVSLGGIPWAAPHTRPTVVVTTESEPGLSGVDSHPPDAALEVPASIAQVVETEVTARNIPAAGYWARVPHYVGNVYYPGVVALVERVSRRAGVDIPLGSLVDDAAAQRRQLAAVIESRPDARRMVERYEQAADAGDAAWGPADDAEGVAEEIERFLRDQAEDL